MSPAEAPPSDGFVETVQRLRDDYWKLRERTNIFDPHGRMRIDMDTVRVDGRKVVTIWYDDGAVVRLADRPGTLSGDILRLHRDLPPFEGSIEIDGDTIRAIENPPTPPEDDDDTEDLSVELAQLPLVVDVDRSKHFLKRGKYRSEIHNLLKCQGGTCPGEPLSPHVVRLLGRSADGQLVLEKLTPHDFILHRFCSVAIYRRWILHIIAGLKCLHSVGIVHRDVRVANLVFSPDGQHLKVCDLEGRWGMRGAPEVALNRGLDAGWTEKSDIYDIGPCIKGIVYANAPFTGQVEWPVPPPFDRIVEACMRPNPQDRPTLDELSIMVEQIDA